MIFAQSSLYCDGCQMIFQLLHPIVFTSWPLAFYQKQEPFLLFHSSVDLLTEVWAHGILFCFVFFPIAYNSLPCLIILVLKLSQIWPVGEPFTCFLRTCPTNIFWNTTFWPNKMFGLILCPPCPSPGVSHGSKEMVSLIGDWI